MKKAETERNKASSVFARYASFYDVLYADKDYESECDFLETILGEHGLRSVLSVVDLGCGTGSHDIPLARRGYEVTGIDRSPEMIAQAREKALEAGLSVEFLVEDVRTFDLGRTFDAVISMFAVVSYQCNDEDLLGMMQAARRHLDVGGLFVFDGWFGPAVLAQRPEEKAKQIVLLGGEVITRSASPELDEAARTVEVHYRVERRREDDLLEKSEESHKVRYLFPEEIATFLDRAGFKLVALGPFMNLQRPPGELDWNFSAVARAR